MLAKYNHKREERKRMRLILDSVHFLLARAIENGQPFKCETVGITEQEPCDNAPGGFRTKLTDKRSIRIDIG